ncbi:NUDIX domain-containing protein [Lentzea atacamensis]|uniref:NUDIX domain-containing protein n=1 Tax=Lentzea atacamensis TaxID=531938 RepID=UPI003898E043
MPDGLWHLPSGKLDAGESVLDAAVREAEEEVGVLVEPGDLRHVHTLHVNGSGPGTASRPVLRGLPLERRTRQPRGREVLGRAVVPARWPACRTDRVPQRPDLRSMPLGTRSGCTVWNDSEATGRGQPPWW